MQPAACKALGHNAPQRLSDGYYSLRCCQLTGVVGLFLEAGQLLGVAAVLERVFQDKGEEAGLDGAHLAQQRVEGDGLFAGIPSLEPLSQLSRSIPETVTFHRFFGR